MKPIHLSLDFPPSANTYYRNVNGRMLISKRGREYASLVQLDVEAQLGHEFPALSDRLSVTIHAHPPDRHKRDIDNLLKPTLDALTKAGVWLDDSQIDSLAIVRCEIVGVGRLWIEIREFIGAEK